MTTPHAKANEAPLILTLRLDGDSFARFQTERRAYFPPERNFIPAHLTLFHHLPGDRYDAVVDSMSRVAAAQSPFPVHVRSLRFLGQGTAYDIASTELMDLRADLATQWSAHLTRQDAAGFRPHVTIQNKSPATDAKQLFDRLSSSFVPFEAVAVGLLLWRYRGGPWEAAGEFDFAGAIPPERSNCS